MAKEKVYENFIPNLNQHVEYMDLVKDLNKNILEEFRPYPDNLSDKPRIAGEFSKQYAMAILGLFRKKNDKKDEYTNWKEALKSAYKNNYDYLSLLIDYNATMIFDSRITTDYEKKCAVAYKNMAKCLQTNLKKK